jgi:hypothetical protein
VTAGGEPGRDDSGLPPVNIEIPDDARELERDVLAYRRELRAQRRRRRVRRIFAPLSGPGTALPLIATCMALSLIAGMMLSFLTISPASAPTRPATHPSAAAQSPGTPAISGTLPHGTVLLGNRYQDLSTLVSDVLILIPSACGCGVLLSQLVSQSVSARVPVYFVQSGPVTPELASLTAQYGGGKAKAVHDTGNVLQMAFAPSGLTALLVYKNAGAEVHRGLGPGASLGDLHRLLGTP